MRIWKLNVFMIMSINYLLIIEVISQELSFSQFYSSTSYLNPSLAGSDGYKLSVFYRRQWQGVGNGLGIGIVNFDVPILDRRVGLAVNTILDKSASNLYETIGGNFYANYNFNITKDWIFRSGLGLGYYKEKIACK